MIKKHGQTYRCYNLEQNRFHYFIFQYNSDKITPNEFSHISDLHNINVGYNHCSLH